MTDMKTETKTHPTDIQLADYLGHTLPPDEKARLESHVASCEECLEKIVVSYDSVKGIKTGVYPKKGASGIMKKINIYLVLAIISFALSFSMPQYFFQFLLATLLLGIKWVADSKSTRMLIMIHEAWKKGGEKEASKILQSIDPKKRF